MSEKHPLNAQSPYAATKIGADQLALSYHKSFNLNVKIIRPFNCYGPRQSMRAVIPTIILQMINNRKYISIGNTETFRDYTFVKDLCEAYWFLYKSSKSCKFSLRSRFFRKMNCFSDSLYTVWLTDLHL